MEDRPIGIKILTVLYAIGAGFALIAFIVAIPGIISNSGKLAEAGISRIFLAYTLVAGLGLLFWATAGLIVGERWGWIGLVSQLIYTLATNATTMYNLTQLHEPQSVKTIARTAVELLILVYILTTDVLNFFNFDSDERWVSLGKAAGIAVGIFTLQQVLFWVT